MSLDRDAFYIDGGWRAPASDATLQVISPHSEEVIATVPEASVGDVDAAVAAARKAFDEGPWPRMTPAERIAVIEAFSGLYAAKLTEMAELISLEMGSPTSFSQLAQSPAPWMQIESFLAIAREFPWEAARPGSLGSDVVVRHEPVGVVAAIPPWNVPQFTVMSKVVPALLAGLAFLKFVVVVALFMHLWHDSPLFTGIFTLGMIIGAGTLVGLLALFSYYPPPENAVKPPSLQQIYEERRKKHSEGADYDDHAYLVPPPMSVVTS